MTQRRFSVASIGRAARQALAEESEGRVLAVFRRSLYVEMEAGRLACIGASSLGDGPLNARAEVPEGIDFERAEIRQHDPVYRTDSDLVVGASLAFSLSGASYWRPPEAPATVDYEKLRCGLDLLLGATAAKKEMSEAFFADHAVATAALEAWMSALVNDGGAPPPEEAEMLIGLGGGLTPAGDDWIGGAMIALRTLDRAQAARGVAEWALPMAQNRTGKISVAHLAAAAAGEGSAALHEAINAICTADPGGLATALAGIDEIGHTSGWDALAGSVAVLFSYCDLRF